MRLGTILVSIILSSFFGWSQSATTHLVADIEDQVFDVSGIVELSGKLFVIGDSGNEAAIYQIDFNGLIQHKIHLANAVNVDWEELQLDAANNLYIGDIGNNLGHREDLTIYKIPWFDTQFTQDTIFNAQVITFNYEDQAQPPIPNSLTHFDCEAFLILDNHIELYSKNRALTGYCKRYKLPKTAGDYQAQLVDSFPSQNWITGATKTKKNGSIKLLSDQSFMELDTASNAVREIHGLPGLQLEGICSLEYENQFLLVEDVEDAPNSRLYATFIAAQGQMEMTTYPNPSSTVLRLDSPHQILRVKVLDLQGQLVHDDLYEWYVGRQELDISKLQSGIYFVQAHSSTESVLARFLVR